MILYLPERRCELQRTGGEERRRMTDEPWYPVTPVSRDLWSERTPPGQIASCLPVLHTSAAAVRREEEVTDAHRISVTLLAGVTPNLAFRWCVWVKARKYQPKMRKSCTNKSSFMKHTKVKLFPHQLWHPKSHTRGRGSHENGMHVLRYGWKSLPKVLLLLFFSVVWNWLLI